MLSSRLQRVHLQIVQLSDQQVLCYTSTHSFMHLRLQPITLPLRQRVI